MNKTENIQKRNQWRQHITNFETGNLSQVNFCQQHNLVPHQFSYYYGLFKNKEKKLLDVNQVIAPVKILDPKINIPADLIKLTLPNGVQCNFPCHIDKQVIQQIIGRLLAC